MTPARSADANSLETSVKKCLGEVRPWKDKEFLVFDETFTHDIWNRSGKPRLLLHIGVWHPDLTPLEIETISGWFERSKLAE